MDDVGKKINPLIVDGQLHGGIAQGVGQALWEDAVYGDDGQLLSGSMLDRAAAGVVAAEPRARRDGHPVAGQPDRRQGRRRGRRDRLDGAVANAVNDALSPLGINHLDMPFTAQTVWRAIQSAKGGRA